VLKKANIRTPAKIDIFFFIARIPPGMDFLFLLVVSTLVKRIYSLLHLGDLQS
jgi:hypothetical protein